MAEALEPVDMARCQCESITKTPWALGGTHRVERCGNAPTVIATETKAQPDGQVGKMSLCNFCFTEAQKKFTKGEVTYEVIT